MASIIIFCTIFTCVIGKKNILNNGLDTSPTPYQSVISLWQIDGFEGGIGSRKQFLLGVARKFEKKCDGVLIMVSNQTIEGANQTLKDGNYPDVISFSNGINVAKMSEIKVEKQSKEGKISNTQYAVTWCMGGYVLIANPNLVSSFENLKEIDQLLVSQGEYTQPLIALSLEGITAKNVEVLKPMDAYVKFVTGKVSYFLGTQRDIFRLNNRGMEVLTLPLNKFSDLNQHISITTTDQMKRYYAQEFINFLLSDEIQHSLNKIGMFSRFHKVSYDNDCLVKMQKLSDFQTISAFIDKHNLSYLQNLSLDGVKGDEESLNKIKKLLI